jgi:uncharacterized RDD family membrane protein YckC
MDWFYEDDNRKVGPVTETEISTLVKSGRITGGTKVWNEKISKWTTYGELMGDVVAEVPGNTMHQAEHNVTQPSFDNQEFGAGDSTCLECGRTFPVDEMVQHGEFNICASCKDVFFQKVKEGVSTGDMHYGGFWIRFAAKMIDWLIMQVVSTIIFFITGSSMKPIFMSQSANPTPEEILNVFFSPAFVFTMLILIIIPIFYTTFFVGKYSATPGKMACGLKVVTEDGQRLSYMRAFGRYFAEIISGMILYIGYIMAAFDYEKRALHDRICTTRVIKK